MSQSMIRRGLTVIGIAAVLLLAAPAPSRAAGVRGPALAPADHFLAHVWAWVEGLLGNPKQPEVQRKDTVQTSPLPSPTSSQGPMIDPDGVP